jgi:TfoX/Sxy family transcriptional regulator of competence genes
MAHDPWKKASPELVDRFHEAVAGIDGVEVRKMFGYPAAFIAGNLTAGLHQESVMLRLAEDEREERIAEGWSLFEPMPGRPMREYLALPQQVAADVDAMRRWIERAAAHVRTLPPKAPKATKVPKKPKAR